MIRGENSGPKPKGKFTNANDTEAGKVIRGENNDTQNYEITYKSANGTIFKHDTATGKWYYKDNKGKHKGKFRGASKPDTNKLTEVDRILKESESLAELQDNLGDGYFIESFENGLIITELPNRTELALNSIFGYKLTNESSFEESSAFDKELSELSTLFENL